MPSGISVLTSDGPVTLATAPAGTGTALKHVLVDGNGNIIVPVADATLQTLQTAILSVLGNVVDRVTNQVVGGNKTLTGSIVLQGPTTVPTLTLTDNSQAPASSAFVKSLRQRASVLDFPGVDPTGTTDSTAGLQAALNANVPLWWPAGTYLTSGVTCNTNKVDWLGAGKRTRLLGTTVTGDIITLGPAVEDVAIREMVVWTKVQKTAGAAVRATIIELGHFDRFDIGTQDDYAASGALLYDGMVLAGYESIRHTNSWIIGGTHNGVTISSTPQNTFGVGYWQDFNTWVTRWGQDGVSIAGGANANLDSNIFLNGRYGVYISTTIAAFLNREVFFGPNCAVDSNGQGALYVDVGSINYLSATGAWFCGSTTGNGVTIVAGQPTNAMLKFVACRLYANAQHGLVTSDGQALIVADSEVMANGSGNGGGHGIWINNPGSGIVTLTGNKVTNNGTTGKAGWGIILSGNCPSFNVTDNECFGNYTGQLSSSAFGPNQIVANNPGATTANSMTNSLVMYNNSGAAWDLDRTQNTYAVVSGGILDLPPGGGFVLISNNTDGTAAAFVCGGGAAALLGQSGSSFAAGAQTSGKVSLYYNAAAAAGACYEIYNGTGATVTLMLCTIKTGGTP